MKIEFYKHSLDSKDISEVNEVLNSLFLTTGEKCLTFENKFSSYTGLLKTVSLSSCTAALHLALTALGIGKGDEVITSPMTFIATITSILHTGATPVLVDVEPDSGLISPERIREHITSKTKAIIPIHLYGNMADMNAIKRIADEHGLFVIEDAAHCIEAERDGCRPGELSTAACYSFYATKNLCCGEGGALGTNFADLADNVKKLRLHGMNKEAVDRYKGLYQHWDMEELGWKYNLSDIQAALLINQLDRLDSLWGLRNTLFKKYQSSLSNINQITLPKINGKSALHLFTILVPSPIRDALLSQLGQKGIGAAVNYRSVNQLTWFQKNTDKYIAGDLQHSESFGARTISLPFYPSLTDGEIDYVVQVLASSLQSLSHDLQGIIE